METELKLLHNPYVDGLPHYNAGLNLQLARQICGRQDVAALASNENPYGCSPRVLELSLRLDLSRYPDAGARQLRAALAECQQISEDQIMIGNGSEELIANICRAFLAPGDKVLTVTPAFGLHEIQPRTMGAQVTKVPMTPTGGFDIPALQAELRKGPRLFFISSPWNPVGTGLTIPQLDALISAAGSQTLFVYDEAYFEFRDGDAPDGLKVLQKYKLNWIVLRTFSKAYGLAGLRVGYGLTSSPEIARLVDLVRTPFAVNVMAQAAASVALNDQEWMKRHVALINAEREALSGSLKAMGLRPPPSQANFLFVDVRRSAKPVAEALLRSGIIIKAWTEPKYENYIRISVGLPDDNARLVKALSHFLNNEVGDRV